MSFSDKLREIERNKEEIDGYGKLPDEVLKKVNYKFRLDWNYTSNSMEGNTLTRQETRSVMVGIITVSGKPIRDIREMQGHDEIVSAILKMGKGELNISESRIRDIHKAIMYEPDPEKERLIGQWKTQPNYIYNYKNERFDFVSPLDVPDRMHQLINQLNAKKDKVKTPLEALELAFWFHLEYVIIHPFYDGNGRTARILTNLILISYGFPPIYINEKEKGFYYQYLGDVQGYGGNPDLFYRFMAELLIRSQQIVLAAIRGDDIETL